MRIALLAPIAARVPPRAYGGVESVVAALADGLVDAGHEVTLFATADSRTKATLVSVHDEPPTRPGRRTTAELHHALACFRRSSDFDVVSSHLGVAGAVVDDGADVSLHTVSDPIDRTRQVWRLVAGRRPAPRLVSVSLRQQALAPELPWFANCYNGLDLTRYPIGDGGGGYLAFLGRMSPDKGCHLAIETARRVGLRLRIGAKLRERHEQAYFEAEVRPRLGEDIEYLGELTHVEKVELLRGAAATIYPALAEEAFGLVLAESMACGTPVAALRNGAVPEVVAHGRSGIVVDRPEHLAGAASEAIALDRRNCRRHVEERFSRDRLVASYEQAFLRALDRPRERLALAAASR